jgi:hypothetical protein
VSKTAFKAEPWQHPRFQAQWELIVQQFLLGGNGQALAKNVPLDAALFQQAHFSPVPQVRPSKNPHFGTVHHFCHFVFRLIFENWVEEYSMVGVCQRFGFRMEIGTSKLARAPSRL